MPIAKYFTVQLRQNDTDTDSWSVRFMDDQGFMCRSMVGTAEECAKLYKECADAPYEKLSPMAVQEDWTWGVGL